MICFPANKEVWKSQIDTFFDNVLLTNGSLTVESVEGDTLTITKDKTVWKGKDEHVQVKGKKLSLNKNEYYVKLSALSHIDELSEVSTVQRNKDGSRKVEPDKKNHPFAKDGFEYRTVFFKDIDGKYYRIVLSVGLADGISTIYNIGQIKETVAPTGAIISVIGSKARSATVSNTKISQNSFGVNSYDMQNAEKNSQYSFSPEDISAEDDTEWYNNFGEKEENTERTVEENAQENTGVGQTRENERKKVAQGKTLEELEQELSERELFNRAYMSEMLEDDRPQKTVEVNGEEMDSAAYMDMVEDSIPDTEEGIEAFMEDVSKRRASEIVRQ